MIVYFYYLLQLAKNEFPFQKSEQKVPEAEKKELEDAMKAQAKQVHSNKTKHTQHFNTYTPQIIKVGT